MTGRRRKKKKLRTSQNDDKTKRQVLVKPSAFEPREWFQKLARLPDLATAGPFGGASGASALSEAFSSLAGAAEASAAADASSAAAAPAAAAVPRPPSPVSVPGYSQRTAAALLRLLDLIREGKGRGSASRFADAAAAAAEDDNAAAAAGTTAMAGDNAAPSSSPLATVYVIAHALSDPAAFAPALRAAAADRVGVSWLFLFLLFFFDLLTFWVLFSSV